MHQAPKSEPSNTVSGFEPGLVSIIVPSYNCAEFIAETLDSAFAQTEVPTEVIVVDDGSTDHSAELLNGYGDRIQLVLQDNRGASMARDAGTRLARGAFIQYLDADDLLCPGTLAARVAALTGSGADVVYVDWRKIAADGTPQSGGQVESRPAQQLHPDPEAAILRGFWAPPAALMYTREIVDRIGGWHPHLRVIQDARFLFDAAHTGAKLVHAAGVGAHYRVRPAHSLSRRDKLAFYREVHRNATEIERLWRARGPLSESRRRALTEVLNYTSRGLLGRPGEEARFQDCVARIRRFGIARPWSWPRLAGALVPIFGAARTAHAMRLLGRPPDV